MKRSTLWLNKGSQQGILMKVANFPSVIRNGPVPIITQKRKARSDDEKTFKVGESTIGGEETIQR